jgi:hypothetical protein
LDEFLTSVKGGSWGDFLETSFSYPEHEYIVFCFLKKKSDGSPFSVTFCSRAPHNKRRASFWMQRLPPKSFEHLLKKAALKATLDPGTGVDDFVVYPWDSSVDTNWLENGQGVFAAVAAMGLVGRGEEVLCGEVSMWTFSQRVHRIGLVRQWRKHAMYEVHDSLPVHAGERGHGRGR